MRKTTSTQRPQVTTRRGKPVCMVQSGASMIRQRQNGTQMVQRLRHIHGILLAEFLAVRDAVFLQHLRLLQTITELLPRQRVPAVSEPLAGIEVPH